MTSIVLTNQAIPQTGALELEINISTTVNLSAEEARRRVNRFVHRKISYLMQAIAPQLAVADVVYWRVPVVLTYPSYGSVGEVGYIDVAVDNGELQIDESKIAEIKRRAEDITARTAFHTAPAS